MGKKRGIKNFLRKEVGCDFFMGDLGCGGGTQFLAGTPPLQTGQRSGELTANCG